MNRAALIWVALLMIAVGLLPLVSVGLASAIAGSAGCLEEGAAPCPYAGTPAGTLLANMLLMGWYAVLSIPVGFVGVLLLIFALWRRPPAPEV